jgi:hypothetical protein
VRLQRCRLVSSLMSLSLATPNLNLLQGNKTETRFQLYLPLILCFSFCLIGLYPVLPAKRVKQWG